MNEEKVCQNKYFKTQHLMCLWICEGILIPLCVHKIAKFLLCDKEVYSNHAFTMFSYLYCNFKQSLSSERFEEHSGCMLHLSLICNTHL